MLAKKLSPVFPWEVERLRPLLVTLVNDLIDRAKVRPATIDVSRSTFDVREVPAPGCRVFALHTKICHSRAVRLFFDTRGLLVEVPAEFTNVA